MDDIKTIYTNGLYKWIILQTRRPVNCFLKKFEGGATQKEIAEILNISRGAYANVENGKREPDIETLATLATHYGVTIDHLVDLKGEPKMNGNDNARDLKYLVLAYINSEWDVSMDSISLRFSSIESNQIQAIVNSLLNEKFIHSTNPFATQKEVQITPSGFSDLEKYMKLIFLDWQFPVHSVEPWHDDIKDDYKNNHDFEIQRRIMLSSGVDKRFWSETKRLFPQDSYLNRLMDRLHIAQPTEQEISAKDKERIKKFHKLSPEDQSTIDLILNKVNDTAEHASPQGEEKRTGTDA